MKGRGGRHTEIKKRTLHWRGVTKCYQYNPEWLGSPGF